MNKQLAILSIIAFNAVPIIGVAFFNWQPFEAFWFFWLETLIMAVFNTIRIIYSQAQPVDAVNKNAHKVYHINAGIKYLFIKIGIFLFYALFIIVFIGFVNNDSKDKTTVLSTLLFQNKLFNIGLLISIVSQSFYLINNYFKNGAYLTDKPDSYTALFDGRQLVIHIAIVLGAVGSTFLVKNTSFGNYGNIFIISLLCISKCLLDLFNYSNNQYKVINQ